MGLEENGKLDGSVATTGVGFLINPVQSESKTLPARLTRFAGLLSAQPEAAESWRWDVVELAATRTQRDVMLHVGGLVWASIESRAAWLLGRATAPLVSLICWLLRSQARTCIPIALLPVWGGLETKADTGLGAAILLVLTSGLGLHTLVSWARMRLKIELRKKADTRGAGSDTLKGE
ncbi:hypothetical protein AB0I81_15770 [Nonomuraea sp. NPDC050404]|uniref:hypothetical protein n=1 Tax=Nonomuraea sp. NPDC050404 TaxID=3155783 RepID=UPI00340C8E2E